MISLFFVECLFDDFKRCNVFNVHNDIGSNFSGLLTGFNPVIDELHCVLLMGKVGGHICHFIHYAQSFECVWEIELIHTLPIVI